MRPEGTCTCGGQNLAESLAPRFAQVGRAICPPPFQLDRLSDQRAQPFANFRQVMPAVAQGVIFDDKLRGNRRSEAEREGRSVIQLFVGECPNYSGGLFAVLAQ